MNQQIDIELLQQEWSKRYGQVVAELSIAKTMIAEMAAEIAEQQPEPPVDAYQI